RRAAGKSACPHPDGRPPGNVGGVCQGARIMVAEWTELAFGGPFDLAASARFLEGFTPAARPDAARRQGELRFAFPCAPSWRPVGVVVRQERPDGPVLVRVCGDPSDVDSAVG